MFDLSRKSTLSSVKEWYRQARLLNKSAVPFLIGTKFDIYSQQDEQDREETLKQVRIVGVLMRNFRCIDNAMALNLALPCPMLTHGARLPADRPSSNRRESMPLR